MIALIDWHIQINIFVKCVGKETQQKNEKQKKKNNFPQYSTAICALNSSKLIILSFSDANQSTHRFRIFMFDICKEFFFRFFWFCSFFFFFFCRRTKYAFGECVVCPYLSRILFGKDKNERYFSIETRLAYTADTHTHTQIYCIHDDRDRALVVIVVACHRRRVLIAMIIKFELIN